MRRAYSQIEQAADARRAAQRRRVGINQYVPVVDEDFEEDNMGDVNWQLQGRGKAYKTHTLFTERGPETLNRYGYRYSDATPQQQSNRIQDGFYGRGKYGRRRYKRKYNRYPRYKRSSRKMKGRGGYFGRLLGGMAGGFVGNPELGAELGDKAGDAVWAWAMPKIAKKFSKRGLYTGVGQYDQVATNDLVDGGSNIFEVPQFHPQSDGVSMLVSHKEYIGDIYGPSDSNFSNQYFPLNPGLKQVFPWLSQIAANYDEYELKQCIFTYKSTVAEFASGTGQVGQVITATQYNAQSEPFSDKRSMMEYDAAESCKTTVNLVSGVECDPDKLSGSPGKFVRTSPPNGDINDYDHGIFNIAVHDVPAGYEGQALGELWISYTVLLRKPKLFTSRGFAQALDVYQTYLEVAQPNQPMGQDLLAIRSYATNNIGTKINNTVSGKVFTQTNVRNLRDNSVVTAASVVGTAGHSTICKVTIPANFEGNLEILFEVTTETNNGGVVGLIYGEGNVKGIRDIPAQYGAYSKVGVLTTDNTKGHVLHGHIRVSQATNDVDNCFYICAVTTTGTAAKFVTNLIIQSYNCLALKKQDGTNDECNLINYVTGQPDPAPSY